METKIILYDADDKKVGETFARRAKQLVKQQRAQWVDDTQTAIRFIKDMDDWQDSGEISDESLIALAEKRILEQKRFIVHSIAVIPTWLLLFWISGDLTRSDIWPAFFTGVFLAAYLIHIYQFAIPRLRKRSLADREERKARRLATEIAHLKAELQHQSK